MKHFNLSIFVVVFFLSVFTFSQVYADAWWGEGYRSPEWVLQNGGTIIYFIIEGAKDKNKVTAKMVINGSNVEREHGTGGFFDDALPGQTVTIRAIVNGREASSPAFVMQKGETRYVKFKVKKKKVKFDGMSSKVRRRPVVKKIIEEETIELTDGNNMTEDKDMERDKKFFLFNLNWGLRDLVPVKKDENCSQQEDTSFIYRIISWF